MDAQMKPEQIAIQLYTLRDFCKTAADYAAVLKKVRATGYRHTEAGSGNLDFKANLLEKRQEKA